MVQLNVVQCSLQNIILQTKALSFHSIFHTFYLFFFQLFHTFYPRRRLRLSLLREHLGPEPIKNTEPGSLYTPTKLYLESKVWGSWIFSTVVIFGSHWDLTGLAAAKIDVLAFNWQMMPALAIDNVCCSLEKQNYINQWLFALFGSRKRGWGGCLWLKLGNMLEINVQHGHYAVFRLREVRIKNSW